MKRRIRLTESDLNRIIEESVNRVLAENNADGLEIWYRGYDSRYGSQNNHLLWITDDISYARTYGNRVEEIVVNSNMLKPASLDKIEDILGDEIDCLDGPSREEAKELLSFGYNCHRFYANSGMSDCICLWDVTPIVNRRELSRGEFDGIEQYDGFDNVPY